MSSTDETGMPRVLVVSAAPFGPSTGTGVTLSNLFDGWPRERLALVYTMDASTSSSVCAQQRLLDPRAAPVDHYLRRLLAGSGRHPSATTGAVLPARGGARPRLHEQLRAAGDLSPVWVPHRLRQWVRQFRPDLVYSLLGSMRIMKLTAALAEDCGVGVVPHFMDDWTTTLYSGGELLGYARRCFDAQLGRVLRMAPAGFCISQPMADEYERRYGIPCTAFVNCVDDTALGDPEPTGGDGTVRLLYVGGLHLDRWQSLRSIAAGIEAGGEGAADVTFTIHAPQRDLDRYGAVFAGLTRTRLGRPLGGAEVAAVLATADVLVHVESFDEDVRRYTRLSLSTKIPQYLAAGRPILAYGPVELASMRHIRTADAGVVVGRPDAELLTAVLRALCGDAQLRRRLALNGHAYAVRHHRKGLVAGEFAACLTRIARGEPVRSAPVVHPQASASGEESPCRDLIP